MSQQTCEEGQATEVADAVQQSGQYWLDAGDAYYQQEAYEEALTAYMQAIQLAPVPVAICIRMGDVLFQLGYYEQALAAYEQVLQREPENAYALNCSGNA